MSDPDITPISGCNQPQRRGLILYPPFLAPCGCWDDLFLPTAGLAASTAKKAFARQFAKKTIIGLSSRITYLKKVSATAKDLQSFISDRIKFYIDRIEALKKRLYTIQSKIIPQIKKLETEIKILKDTIITQKARWAKYLEEQTRRGLTDAFMDVKYANWKFTRDAVAKPIDGYAGLSYKKLAEAQQRLRNLMNGQLDPDLMKEIDIVKKEIKIAERELSISRPQIQLGEYDNIPAGSYNSQKIKLEETIKKINETDIRRVSDDIREVERFPEAFDPISQKYPDVATALAAFLVDILNTFALVGPHICRDGENGVTLNLENCKCDICPPDKQLCQPISFDPGIRLPWTAIADSANYCLDPCCGGQVDSEGNPLRIYKPSTYVFNGGIGELLGVEQCECDCPQDGLGQNRIKRPCVSSPCNDGYACASEDFPDDICTTLRLFSKFYWYDGSDPTKPWCAFRCKEEMSDADCFSTYGEFAKWDTRNAYCSCICKEKSETDCPEKATYTMVDSYHNDPDKSYCDELENPTEPVCTCVCDRSDDCPQGQVLNRLVTGPNACECVPEYDGYPYGSQQTYYFDNNSQSWTISQDS